jgi:hypothetical protein
LLPNPLKAEAREKNRTANAIFELLTFLDSELMRVEYLGELSRLIGIREDILSTDYKNYLVTKTRHSYVSNEAEQPDKTEDSINSKSKLTNAEEDLILALFEFPDLGANLFQVVDNEWIDDTQASGRILNRILAEAEQGSWQGISQMEEIVETDQERNYYYHLRSKEIKTENLLRGVEDSVVILYKRFIHKRIQSLDVELANAQTLPLKEQFKLQKERTELNRSISNPPAVQLPSEF